MANKRMFTMHIVDSDAFLDMPLSAQCLYFHLNMRADDDGFVSSPKRIARLINASDDDLRLLVAKRFILVMNEDGVIVIKHWKMHNTIKSDRYIPTVYQEEKEKLLIKDNKSYSLTSGNILETNWKQNVSTDIDIDLDIDIDKDKEINNKATKHKYGEYQHVLLTDDELDKLKERFTDWEAKIKELDEGIELKGYKYKSHYLAILKWAKNGKSRKEYNAAEEMKVEDVDIEALRKRMRGM